MVLAMLLALVKMMLQAARGGRLMAQDHTLQVGRHNLRACVRVSSSRWHAMAGAGFACARFAPPVSLLALQILLPALAAELA